MGEDIKAREEHKMKCKVCNIGNMRCLRCEAARPEVEYISISEIINNTYQIMKKSIYKTVF